MKTPKRIPLNLNDLIELRLNAHGLEILEQACGQEYLDVCYPQWRTGAVRMELWKMAHDFGPVLYNGCEVPFEMNAVLLQWEEDGKHA